MKFLFVLAIISSFSHFAAADAGQHHYHGYYHGACTNNTEPKIGEVFSLLLPIPSSDKVNQFVNSFHQINAYQDGSMTMFPTLIWQIFMKHFAEVYASLYNTRVPLRSLITLGEFRLNPTKFGNSADMLLMIQEQSLEQRWLCWVASFLVKNRSNYFCRCWKGENLEGFTARDVVSSHLGLNEHAKYCVTPAPCNPTDSMCSILVDPIKITCLLPMSPFVEHHSHIEYVPHVPMLGSALVESLLKNLTANPLQYPSNANYILSSFLFVLDYIPLSIFLLAVGLYVMACEYELSESILVQYLASIVISLFVAVFWLLFVVFKTATSVFRSNIGILETFAGSYIQTSSALFMFMYFFTSLTAPDVWKYVFEHVLLFWNEGAFGVYWVGKAYFLFSVVVSILLTKYFHLYEEDSYSHWVLRNLIKCIGTLILSKATPNSTVSIIFILLGLKIDDILYYIFRLQMSADVASKPPSYYYSGDHLLTSEEYHSHGDIYTKNALEKLRQHMRVNPGNVDKITNRFLAEGKGDLAMQMERFIQGRCSGLPEAASIKNTSNSYWKMWTLIVLIGIFACLCLLLL